MRDLWQRWNVAKSNLILIIWNFYNWHHTTYLSFWLLGQQSFKRNLLWTLDITNYLSKKCCNYTISRLIYTHSSMYFSYFNFEVLSILGNRLSSFAVFLWYWEDTFLWQEELLYFPFYGGSNFVFSSWFLFYIGKKLSPRKLQNVK